MRGRTYLLALVLAVLGAIYFASNGNPVGAALIVFPGYFVIAYVLILLSTFLPGGEKRRYEAARAEAFPEYYRVPEPPPSTPMHPAFMGGISETVYSGHGFLGLLESGDLLFGSATRPPETHQ